MSDPASADPSPAGESHADHPLGPRAIAELGLIEGWRALRANALPGLILWGVAVAVVAGYYLVDPVTDALDRLGAVKDHHGFAYSAVSTALFAGVIPWVVTRLRSGPHGQGRLIAGLFIVLFWAEKGLEVDLFYRFQSWLFGHGTSVGTIVGKVLFDMLVYMPIWAVPSTIAGYRMERYNWHLGRWWRSLTGRWVAYEVLPIIIANWAVWVPAIVGIYLLPSPLQLPMQNLVLCLWALMLLFMTDPKNEPREIEEPA
ncbi:MAG: hypothetical protein AAGB29_10180 [Planctomycetota bacterium]